MIQPEPEDLPKDNPKLEIAVLRVILFSIHNDEWKSFQCHHQTALRTESRVWGCREVVRLPDLKLKTLGDEALNASLLDMLSIPRLLVPRLSLSIPYGIEDIGGSVVPEEVTEEDDPKTFDEAMKSQDVAFWKEAINDEMDSIMDNNIWVLVDLSPGIDYFDTYAPVARISTIRLLIVMASIHNLIIHQMDVKTAFLNGELDKEVYMNQPRGFIMPGNKNKVCKLIKSLYRLKQSPKQWHQKFDKVVLSNGYLLNQADKCVYSKFDESGKGVIICLYVDDMLIFGTNQVQVDLTKEFLSSRLSIKDIGEADVILVSTPMDTSEKLMPNNGQTVSQLEYSRVIDYLMYAMTCTRPDITFVVGKLSRYTSNPGTQHWQAIQRVLKYLKKTMDYKLAYTGYPSVLEGYTDASWISNSEDNSSTSGWVLFDIMDDYGGAISWASKKQTCITGSTMESEFVALAAAGKEAEWLRNLILEIPLWSKPIAPISIRCDSDATLAKSYSQMYNGKSRHLGDRHSMIRELIMNEVISIEFVRSQQNLADHLTKGLARDVVIKSTEGMRLKGLKYMYLHIILRMCLERAENEDEVFTS
ncbi:zinc finger, CCHC-type containing protein [Tanacetum coccineum]